MTWLNRTNQLTGSQGILILGILPVRPTPLEQFLMIHAVERSLDGKNTMLLPPAYGDTVSLDTSGLTDEQRFFKGAISGYLGERGYRLPRIHMIQGIGSTFLFSP